MLALTAESMYLASVCQESLRHLGLLDRLANTVAAVCLFLPEVKCNAGCSSLRTSAVCQEKGTWDVVGDDERAK
eukprot:4558050-Amphidinium_carterae.2